MDILSVHQVTVLFASPDIPRKSDTMRFVGDPFIEGLKDAGIPPDSIHFFDLSRMRFTRCIACWSCWVKKPGMCKIIDPLLPALQSMKQSDLIVLAGPIHIDLLPGDLIQALGRGICLLSPFAESTPEGPRYVCPTECLGKRLVVIAVSGFAGQHHFDTLRTWARRLAHFQSWDLAGEVYCDAAWTASHDPQKVRAAGREVARHGAISPETAALLRQNTIQPDEFLLRLNTRAHTQLVAHGIDPAPQFARARLEIEDWPLPGEVREAMEEKRAAKLARKEDKHRGEA